MFYRNFELQERADRGRLVWHQTAAKLSTIWWLYDDLDHRILVFCKYGRAPGSTERVEGERQSAFVRDWVAAGVAPPRQAWPFVALVHGADKYGRDLVDLVRVRDGRSLVADLVAAFPSVAQGARLAGSG